MDRGVRAASRTPKSFMPAWTLVTILLIGGCIGTNGEHLEDVDTWKASLDAAQDPYLLDVRTAEEYEEGHIEGAHLIPYTEISERTEELPEDKNETLWVYCRTDRRSQIAADELTGMGYTDVRVPEGGITAWKAAGHPVVRP